MLNVFNTVSQNPNLGSNVPTTFKSAIKTKGALVGGSLYVTGTYTGVALTYTTSGTGSGAQATIVVAGGAVTTVTITNPGINYQANDVLTASNTLIGGAGSGFTQTISAVTTTYTQLSTDSNIINNGYSGLVLTLLDPTTVPGTSVIVKTIQATAVTSASANVVPLAGGAASTAIVSGTAGKWALLVSDATNWVIMASN